MCTLYTGFWLFGLFKLFICVIHTFKWYMAISREWKSRGYCDYVHKIYKINIPQHTHTQSTEIHSHTTKYYENHWIFYYYLLIQFNREYDDVKWFTEFIFDRCTALNLDDCASYSFILDQINATNSFVVVVFDVIQFSVWLQSISNAQTPQNIYIRLRSLIRAVLSNFFGFFFVLKLYLLPEMLIKCNSIHLFI